MEKYFKIFSLVFTSLFKELIIQLPAEFSKFRVNYYNKRGCKINIKTSISPNVRIRGKFEMDEGSSIAQNCSVSGENAGIFVGKNVMIAPNVVIVAFNHGYLDTETLMFFQKILIGLFFLRISFG